MNFLKFTYDKMNVSDISDLVKHPDCNAISIFVETCKSGSNLENLSVSEGNAKLQRLSSEIRKKWLNVMHIAIYLKLGQTDLNDINITVAISSPFLSESMEAVQFAVNKIRSLKSTQNLLETNFISDNSIYTTSSPMQTSEIDSDICIADDVPPELIQIKADNYQINKRIENFILMKRTILDDRNIKEFLQVESGQIQDKPKEPQCARVDAVLWKRHDSKSHLKVHKVINEWGPQAPKLQSDKNKKSEDTIKGQKPTMPKSINERITNCEKHVGIESPVPADIYARLKNIEDRILELDSISPEYSNFWLKKSDDTPSTTSDVRSSNKMSSVNSHSKTLKRKYTLEDLSNKITKMKQQFECKVKSNEF